MTAAMSAHQAVRTAANARLLLPLLAVAAGTLTVLSPLAWLTVLLDGGAAAMVLLAAAGWGAWPGALLYHLPASRTQQFCVALALGFGLQGTLLLTLGSSAALSLTTASTLVAIGLLLGLVFLAVRSRHHRTKPQQPGNAMSDGEIAGRSAFAPAAALLPVAALLGLLLFGAALPPGVLWIPEGNGYDVLEYHLQAPREFFLAGHIHFLPHNVYGNFPQQVELHYLLLMHLFNDPYAAAIPSQYLHGLLTIAGVIAVAAWTPGRWGPVAAVAVVGGSFLLTYTGVLAYNEGGVLLLTAVVAGLLIQSLSRPPDARLVLLAGLLTGWAVGTKLTAAGLVAAPLWLAWLISSQQPLRPRLALATLWIIGAALAFAPWLIRGELMAGNPVYPFAYELLGGNAWSPEQAAQWHAGHQVAEPYQGLIGRFRLAALELFASGQLSFALWGLGIAGLLVRRDRISLLLGLWIVLALAVWMTMTQMPVRFVLPLVVPLGMAAGRLLQPNATASPPRPLRTPILLIAALGGVFSVTQAWSALEREQSGSPIPLPQLVGATQFFAGPDGVEPLNAIATPETQTWLVGQAHVFYVQPLPRYTVVFNRDPWLDFAAREPDPAAHVAWLARRGVDYVVFSWPEIARLGRTYGFPATVTREWVQELYDAGLTPVTTERVDGLPAYEILAVPPAGPVAPPP